MPELAARCAELHGVDPHAHTEEVSAILARHGITASLSRGTVESLPYPDGFFDAAVAVSTLGVRAGHPRRLCRAAPDHPARGVLVVVTPGATPLWDLALRVSTGESPPKYADRRKFLRPALTEHFTLVHTIRIPVLSPPVLRLYTGLELRV